MIRVQMIDKMENTMIAELVIMDRISIITGDSGSGKTFICDSMLSAQRWHI